MSRYLLVVAFAVLVAGAAVSTSADSTANKPRIREVGVSIETRPASRTQAGAKRVLLPANVRAQAAAENAAHVLPDVAERSSGGDASSRGRSCFCGLDIEGQDFCFLAGFCGKLTPCTSNTACGPDERCLANNCCSPPEDFSCHAL